MIRITDGRYIKNVFGIPVVADIFRATSNIVTMFMKGVQEVVPVKDVSEAFKLRENGFLLFGEIDTKPIEGFDYGNSPSETFKLDLSGKKAALKTTNGTDLIFRVGDGALIGSFLNITSLSRYLRNKEVHIFPANLKNGTAVEDNEFAYALSKRILEPGANIDVNIQKARNGNGSQRLKSYGLESDINFCLQTDVTEIIPVFRNGKIVKLD
ncbi:MAG: 2-phosphosulfolactate phosphatase [Thermoplasmatales archaeon]